MQLDQINSINNFTILQTNSSAKAEIETSQESSMQNDFDTVSISKPSYDLTGTMVMQNIEKIAQIQSTQKEITIQNNNLDKIDRSLRSGGSTYIANNLLEDMSINFKSNISPNLKDNISEDMVEKSLSYFDGLEGAMPLEYDEIKEEINNISSLYSDLNNSLETSLNTTINSTHNILTKKQQENPLTIDFEKESQNFTKENLPEINTTVIETTNISYSTSKLLS